MRTLWIGLFAALALVAAPAPDARAQFENIDTCNGNFVNPVSDICWDCLFPLTVGAFPVVPSNHPDTENFASPICACPIAVPPFIRIGVAIGFWEPARLADVAKDPWCFVNIGGQTIAPGFDIGHKGEGGTDTGGNESAEYFVHWYAYPLLYWLELLADAACVEQVSFDVMYVSELDPLWNDDELSFLIHPEAAIFANPIAQAACAADCVAVSTTGRNFPGMFWCAGCHGSVYPFNGNIAAEITRIQGAALVTERMTYKLHRQLLAWRTSGPAAICQKQIAPIWPRSQYRYQLVNPVPHVSGPGTCPRAGTATIVYESGRSFPMEGEDIGFLVWRKRTCCAL
tara:strand:+ start:5633 stop:6658 length:1026 start_codon:yes stop_codon:yes gene_type:complete